MRPKALFFGTPQFAVPSLDALCEIADVVLVICQPDRPAGRGLADQPPPVKVRAGERGIRVIQPTKVKPPELHAEMRALDADLALVVAYGRILPRGILEAPRRGCVNVHGSLLPRWRGAAPIQWAVAAGDRETGVCLMEMDEGLDTGPVFARASTAIGPDETAGELFERLSTLGADLVRSALPRWLAGELRAEPQDPSHATIARMLAKEDGELDFRAEAQTIHDRVRAMHPWPGATAILLEGDRPNAKLKIHRTRVLPPSTSAERGRIVSAGPDGIVIACGSKGEARIAIFELQLEGKKLDARQFVAGRRLAEDARLALAAAASDESREDGAR